MTTQADVPTQREGFARALVEYMFPQFHRKGSAFASDVQFVYDWEAAAKHGTFLDPLNINAHGDYASRGAATLHSAHWIEHHPQLLAALRKGDTSAARTSLHNAINTDVHSGGKMPSPIDKKTGKYKQTGVPSTLDQIGSTFGALPGAFGKDLSGVGSFFGAHVVLIVVVLALILVMKK